MSRRSLVLLVVVLVAAGVYGIMAKASAARQKQAEQVLDRYMAAVGGKQAFESIQTLMISGKATLNGIPMNLEEYRTAPCQFYAVMSNDKQSQINATDGAVAWTIGTNRCDVLVGDARAYMLREAALDRDVHWQKYYKSAEYKGTETFAGKTCHKIVMTPKEGRPQIRYYDTQTDYLVGEERPLPDRNSPAQTIVRTYDNYRKFGAILLPTTMTEGMGSQKASATIQQVLFNPKIPDEQYERPQAVKLQLVAMPGYLRNAAGER